jgi:transposase InsO family protein
MRIEHRLAPPRHPQTNCMVERFNGRINEVLQQTRFDSQADLDTRLHKYLKLYNHHRSALLDQKHRSRRSKNGSGRSPTYL